MTYEPVFIQTITVPVNLVVQQFPVSYSKTMSDKEYSYIDDNLNSAYLTSQTRSMRISNVIVFTFRPTLLINYS